MKKMFVLNLASAVYMISAPSTVLAQSGVVHPKCNTIEECAQLAMEAAFEAKLALQVAAPIGAVMAFNLSECPVGWSDFPDLNGRVIIGAGEGNGLTPRTVGAKGGTEKHQLTLEEMPKHNHTNGNFKHLLQHTGHWTGKGYDGSAEEVDSAHFAEMLPSGSSSPHENMQPYFVLKYCERKR